MIAKLETKLFEFLDSKIYQNPAEKTSISPRSTILKWIALFFCCMTTFGAYFCFDTIGPLQTPLMETFGINVTQFNLILSVAALPNCIMPIFCGIFIDKVGVKIGIISFAFAVVVGQCISAYGVSYHSFNFLLTGTALLSIGLEAIYAAKNVMVLKWFVNQELAFPLGLTLTMSRLGSCLASFFTPWLYVESKSLTSAFKLGVFLSIVSLIATGLLIFLDYYAEKKEGTLETFVSQDERFRISDLKEFKLILYLLVMITLCGYGTILVFMNNSSDIMNKRFGSNPQLSGKLLSIVYVISTVMTPIFGRFVDKIGKRLQLISGSLTAMAFAHLYISFLRDSKSGEVNSNIVLALVVIGIAYSAYASIIWPCIGLVVKERAQGSANGLALAVENLGLGLLPIIVGIIHDSTIEISYGYFWTEIFLAFVALIGILFTNLAKREDFKNGKILEGNSRFIKKKRLSDGLLVDAECLELSELSHTKL